MKNPVLQVMLRDVSFNKSNVKQLIFDNMKKIVSFIMGLVAFATLNAANTANVTLTLTANGGTEASQVKLRLDPSVTAPTYASWFQNLEAVGTVNIYAKIGAEKYSQYKYNTLTNVPLEVVTNRRAASMQHYTITFSVLVNTETLYLTDLLLDPNNEHPIAIVDGESYGFDVNTTLHPSYVEGSNFVIADRFIINYDPVLATVTTNAYGLATFSFDQDLVAVETEAKLYKGAINGQYLDLTPVNYVKAGEGVIVYNEAAEVTTYHFVAGTGTSSFAGNALIASADWTGKGYVLSGSSLYIYEGAQFPENKAFLAIPAGAPARIVLRFNEEQGVENIAAEGKAVKFVENGRVFIKRGDKVYNLQGQLVK